MQMYRNAGAGKVALQMFLSGCMILLLAASTVWADDCKKTVKSLEGDYESLQSDGGLWRFMEKSSRLRGDSMIGFQIDGKIQRAVQHLNKLCTDGKPLPGEMLKEINDILSTARGINNKSTSRTPAKKLLAMLNDLNGTVTQFLEKNGI